MSKRTAILVFLVVFLITDFSFGQGCSQCKLLAEQGGELDEDSFGSNINYGILYLMIIPYILIMVLFHKRIFAFFKGLLKRK